MARRTFASRSPVGSLGSAQVVQRRCPFRGEAGFRENFKRCLVVGDGGVQGPRQGAAGVDQSVLPMLT